MSVTLAPVTAALRALPSGWSWTALGDICDIVIGRTPRRDSLEYWSGSLPWVTISDLNDGVVTDTRERITTLGAEASGARLLASGTLLFSFKLTIGKMAFAGVDLYTNEAIAGLVPRVGVQLSTEYLRYALSAVNVSSGSSHAVKGRTLNLPVLRAIKIPLPPLPEQKRIAAALREQLDAVARMRAAAENQAESILRTASAFLATAFDSAAVVASQRVSLGELCVIEAPQVDPKLPAFGQLPHVSGENIESGTGRLLEVRSAAEDGMTSGKYLFEPGDVLYSKLRPYLRKVTLVDFRGLCSADMYPVRALEDRLDSRFLKWLLLSAEFTAYADEESRRARMPKLNREQLLSWFAPLPSVADQRRIAESLQTRLDATCTVRAMLDEQAAEIGRLSAALLRRAFGAAS